MKILFVSHEKRKYGSTASMITLIQELKTQYGCEVHVILPNYGQAHELIKKNNFFCKVLFYTNNYRRIGKRVKYKEVVRDMFNFIAVKRLKRIIKKENYDYIVSNSTAVDIGARAAISLGKKHLYYIREFMEEDFSIEYRNMDRMKFLLEASEKIIFISKAIADKYLSLYKFNNYKVIYDGVVKDDYYIPNHEILQKKELRLLQIGALCDGKGTEQSLKYINEINSGIECHLTFVGSGSAHYLEQLNTYICENSLESKVSILPYTNDIKSLLNNADILMMNSKSEGFGRVTIEGMLGGLLVIGKDAAGTSEIVEHNKTGILFKNEQEFMKGIFDINENRKKYQEISKNGQQYAMEQYTPYNNAKNVMNYLLEKV